jgi:hypothetical protein
LQTVQGRGEFRGDLLQQEASFRAWLHQLRAHWQWDFFRKTTQIDLAIRAWIDFRRQALPSCGDIVQEQRLRWERGRRAW